jgi:cytochrome c oxidase cbb3-type subunit I/II
MINGLLTLRGAWDKVREDVILKFFVVAVTAYGMSTFEGPMLSLKNVNAIAHYTDWIPAHVHIGTLGWNGFLIFGMLYWLIPRIFRTQLYSMKMANTHFWIGTLGILFWALPMYWAGFTQSLMWKEFNPDGTLVYGNFLETVTQIVPMYITRSIGGTLYLVGMILLIINIWKTVKQGDLLANEEAEAAALTKTYKSHGSEHWHRPLERKPVAFMILTIVVILIGGVIEIVPTIMIKSNIPTIEDVKPYTALELEGRDIYIREGCNACHSQMIRPFRSETERYGEYSKAGEFVYDHPFLWGSKRTGPDLHREGGKYPHSWHYFHMYDPRTMSPGSLMPRYPWLLKNSLNTGHTKAKLKVMQKLGVPYTDYYVDNSLDYLNKQAEAIAAELNLDPNIEVTSDKQIIALIAYLQRLGTDIKGNNQVDLGPAEEVTMLNQ